MNQTYLCPKCKAEHPDTCVCHLHPSDTEQKEVKLSDLRGMAPDCTDGLSSTEFISKIRSEQPYIEPAVVEPIQYVLLNKELTVKHLTTDVASAVSLRDKNEGVTLSEFHPFGTQSTVTKLQRERDAALRHLNIFYKHHGELPYIYEEYVKAGKFLTSLEKEQESNDV